MFTIGRLCLWMSSRCGHVVSSSVHSAPPPTEWFLFGMTNADSEREMREITQNFRMQTSSHLWESRKDILPREVLIDAFGESAMGWPVSWFKDRSVTVSLDPLVVTDRSGVFTVRKNKFLKTHNRNSPINLVMVYRVHCLSHRHLRNRNRYVDGTVADYWFLRYLQRHAFGEVSPRVYYLSGARIGGVDMLGNGRDLTRLNRFGKLTGASCKRNEFWILRYIVLEQLPGKAVGDIALYYWNYGLPVPLRTVLTAGIEMIKTIQRLAELNLIHGDAHWNNFIWDRENERMKMIDFEHGAVFNFVEMEAHSPRCTIAGRTAANPHFVLTGMFAPAFLHHWATPWDLLNCPSSFGSDLYKVFIALNTLIYGRGYDEGMIKLARLATKDVPQYINLKDSVAIKMFVEHKVKHAGDMFELNEEVAKFLGLQPREFTLDALLLPKHPYGNNETPFYTESKIQVIRSLFHELSGVLFDSPLAIEERPNYAKAVELLQSIRTAMTSFR